MSAHFRTDIEGLRGICVLAVVLFHAFPDVVTGGFIGVDVFFVISGYLITELLVEAYGRSIGSLLADFWARRIRRILPAATLVLFVAAFFAFFVPATDPKDFSRHILTAGLFYHNVRQADDAVNYLASDQNDNLLLHYWSLAVEEQFYLVWPITIALFFALSRRLARGDVSSSLNRRLLAMLVAAVWLASFASSVWLVWYNPSQAFFSTSSRSWQLLTGALVAIMGPTVPNQFKSHSGMIAAVCVGCLMASFFMLSRHTAYPGAIAAIPTVAVGLLIHSGCHGPNSVAAALSLQPLRFAGRISYSWYLWHWPLLVLGHSLGGESATLRCVMITVSCAVAWATLRLVEDPVRQSVALLRSTRATYLLGGLLVGSTVLLGVGLKHLAIDTVEIGSGVRRSAESIRRDRPRIYRDKCLVGFEGIRSPPCVYGAPAGSRTVVLFGDSHAGNWFPALEAAARDLNWRLVVRIKVSCRPILAPQTVVDPRERPYHECERWHAAVLEELGRERPSFIVVGGTSNALPADGERRMLATLAGSARTVVMRDTPWFPMDSVACLRRRRGPAACVWPLQSLRGAAAFPRTPEDDLPEGVRIVDLTDSVCPGGSCRTVLDGRVVTFDSHHFTTEFAVGLTNAFKRILSE